MKILKLLYDFKKKSNVTNRKFCELVKKLLDDIFQKPNVNVNFVVEDYSK